MSQVHGQLHAHSLCSAQRWLSALQAPGLRVCGSLAQSPICSTSASTACISYCAAIWWLDFPGLFATAFGFVFVAARQMAAMAKSGLFPAFLHKMTSCSNTPYTALVGTSLLSLSCVLTAVYLYQPWQRELFSTLLIGSYLARLHHQRFRQLSRAADQVFLAVPRLLREPAGLS